MSEEIGMKYEDWLWWRKKLKEERIKMNKKLCCCCKCPLYMNTPEETEKRIRKETLYQEQKHFFIYNNIMSMRKKFLKRI